MKPVHWLIVGIVVVALLGLLIWARGPKDRQMRVTWAPAVYVVTSRA